MKRTIYLVFKIYNPRQFFSIKNILMNFIDFNKDIIPHHSLGGYTIGNNIKSYPNIALGLVDGTVEVKPINLLNNPVNLKKYKINNSLFLLVQDDVIDRISVYKRYNGKLFNYITMEMQVIKILE